MTRKAIPQEVKDFVLALWDQGLSRKEIAEQVREQFGYSKSEFNARNVHGILLSSGIKESSSSCDLPSPSFLQDKEKEKEAVISAVEAGKQAFKEGIEAATQQTKAVAETANILADTAKKVVETQVTLNQQPEKKGDEVSPTQLVELIKQFQSRDDGQAWAVIAAVLQNLGQQFTAIMQAMQGKNEAIITNLKEMAANAMKQQEEVRKAEENRVRTFYENMANMMKETMQMQGEMVKERLQMVDNNMKIHMESIKTFQNFVKESLERERKHLEELKKLIREAKGGGSEEPKEETPWWKDIVTALVTRGITTFENAMARAQQNAMQQAMAGYQVPALQAAPREAVGGTDMGLFGFNLKGLLGKAIPQELKDLAVGMLDNVIRKAKNNIPPEETLSDIVNAIDLLEGQPRVARTFDLIVKQAVLYRFDELLTVCEKLGIEVGDLRSQVDEKVIAYWEKVRVLYRDFLHRRVQEVKRILETAQQQQVPPQQATGSEKSE